jgi:kinesin family protein 18/19
MIAHISPASIHFEESRNTLTYADRAKYIRTKLRRNVIDVSYHISQYQQIIQELAQEISTLKEQKYDLESKVSHLDPRMNAALMMTSNNSLNSSNMGSNSYSGGSVNHNSAEEKLRIEETLKIRESLLQAFKQQIKLRKNVLDLENAIMDINIEAERHNKILEK